MPGMGDAMACGAGAGDAPSHGPAHPFPRKRENQCLLARIREHHSASDGVMGMPRMLEELSDEGETASPNRIARIMANAGIQGIPQRRQWRRKASGVRPADVRDHLERDFNATEPNTKWVTDITYIHTAEGWLYLCVVIDLFGGKVIGWSMSTIQDRHLVLKAVLMACWQRPGRQPVILHSDRGTQFTSSACEKFLKGHYITLSMSRVGHCGDNAAAEGFFGMLKRERVNRRKYRTIDDARADIFDYIEGFHNPRIQRRLDSQARGVNTFSKLSAKTG
ncbi:hypothetical protein BH23GEM11_BH23GEM11_06580 [soil metagenome]